MTVRSFFLVLTTAAGTLVAGCSMVSVHRVTDAGDYKTHGVRYWMSAPYLVVPVAAEVRRLDTIVQPEDPLPCSRVRLVAPGTEDLMVSKAKPSPTPKPASKPDAPSDDAAKKDNPPNSSTVVWLPDYCQEYAAKQINIFASQKMSLQFTGSQLTSFDSELNSTEVINKLIETAGTLAGAVVGGGKGGGAKTEGAKGVVPAVDAMAGGPTRKGPWHCTVVSRVPPGIYPLVEYGKPARLQGTKGDPEYNRGLRFPKSDSGEEALDAYVPDCSAQPHFTLRFIRQSIADGESCTCAPVVATKSTRTSPRHKP